MRYCLLCLSLLLCPLATFAQDATWQQIKKDARGQTVWFNAWGGDNAVNQYLDWVSGEMKTHYAINLKIVRLADAADAVKRIQTEATSGRKTGGSVDLLWVNGENFRTLKEAGLLQTQWAQTLPNWRYVDTQKPVTEDFSVPTEGAESPWGGAQLTFIARRDLTAQPPQSPQALLEFAQAHPGTVTYPRPPDFTGTAFLEQLLISLTTKPQALKIAPDATTFADVTAPLWHYLDALHPVLWREGKDFLPTHSKKWPAANCPKAAIVLVSHRACSATCILSPFRRMRAPAPERKSCQTTCFRPKRNCAKPTRLSGGILRCLIHKNYLSNSVMRCWHGSRKDSLPYCQNRMQPG